MVISSDEVAASTDVPNEVMDKDASPAWGFDGYVSCDLFFMNQENET
jgi:hypothetical protein